MKSLVCSEHRVFRPDSIMFSQFDSMDGKDHILSAIIFSVLSMEPSIDYIDLLDSLHLT